MLSRARGQARGTWLAALTVALGLVALVLLADAVRQGPTRLDAFDQGLAGLRDTAIGASLFGAADVIGSVPVWFGLVVILAIALLSVSLASSVQLVALVVVAEVVTTVVKQMVDRSRPLGAETVDLLVSAGFPSGHVTRTAVVVGGLLVLVPWCRQRPRLIIGAGLVAVLVMGLARVSAGVHYTTDILGACLLSAVLLGAWCLLDALRRAPNPAVRDSAVGRAGLLAALALAVLLVGPTAAWAASPSPTAGSGGDPRSSGQGPGLVGDAGDGDPRHPRDRRRIRRHHLCLRPTDSPPST